MIKQQGVFMIKQHCFISLGHSHQVFEYDDKSTTAASNGLYTILKHYERSILGADAIRINKLALEIHKIGKNGKDDRWEQIELTKTERTIVAKILGKDSELVLKKADNIHQQIYNKIKEESTLYLYSSGGGGHKSAKDAQVEKNFNAMLKSVIKLQPNGAIGDELTDPTKFVQWCKSAGLVHEVDVLHDYLGSVGESCSSMWDQAQIAGDVKKQENLASLQPLSDLFFGPVIFFKTLQTLIKLNPKKIVSTQAMATPAILFAIRIYNMFYKPEGHADVKLHLYMTDMPTEYAGHYFDSIKSIFNTFGRCDLILHAPKAYEGLSLEKLSGLPSEQIKILKNSELPVRSSFIDAAAKFEPSSKELTINLKEKEEFLLLQKVLKKQKRKAEHSECYKNVYFDKDTIGNGYFLMLGSNPGKSAVEGYVDQFIKQAKENPMEQFSLFAFTGKFENECYYKELCKYILAKEDWPENLQIVPMSYQGPKQLAALELTCNTITRSGGATVMELLVLDEIATFKGLSKKKRLVHAQPPTNTKTMDPKTGIPLWERGNFLFMEKAIGADIVTPDTLKLV